MQIIPLGAITPGSSTPVSVIANFPLVTRASKLVVASLASNTSSAHIYVGTAAMNTSTLAGVFAILTPGDQWILVDEQSTAFQLDAIFAVGENGTDKVLVTGYQR